MTQPDDFGFDENAAFLKTSVARFLTEKFPTQTLHSVVGQDPTAIGMKDCLWIPELWQEMVQLGWSAMAVPESAGGLGLPVVAVAGLVEEVGRAAFPCPLLATLNATYVLANCGESAMPMLAEIAEGASASLAIVDAAGNWEAKTTEVVAKNGRLTGNSCYVQDAAKVDRFLVSAQDGNGLSLYWVAADAPGLTIMADAIVDRTRDQARLAFDDVEGEPVTEAGSEAIDNALPIIWTLLAADICGAAEWQLQTTVDYASQRKQFERVIGGFQAVKHPLVNLMMQIDQSRSLVYNAACALDCEPQMARQFAHMAKASACETAAMASQQSVQLHGGIGFTWEYALHLYFKRQKHSQVFWGDAYWHRAKLAEITLDLPLTAA